MKVAISIFISTILAQFTFGQVKDSTKVEQLHEVVVSGQFSPQSANKSVFQVKVITRDMIERLAGNNLADVLNQTLNISVIPNTGTGKSGVSLFGLDAQYFKILVDNIPMINDEGLGNNTDLTQINLDDVAQIEIIEGAMGVEYGANAVSGVINIITKKSSKYKWQIAPYVQEETIGKEYNLKDEGRHIQSLKIGHNFNSKLYANVVVTTNEFMGYKGNQKGAYYLEDDGLRGYEWLPKSQFNIKSLLNYTLPKLQFFYKMDFFDEKINKYATEVLPNYSPITETNNPTANDQTFSSTRFYHHFNVAGKLEKAFDYNVSVSHQMQKSELEDYNYHIRRDEKTDISKYKYQEQQGFYSKGNFTNFMNTQSSSFQFGYEISSIKGYASAAAGTFNGVNINRQLNSYDVFAASEITISPKFSLRPGIRALFSSQFDTQVALSASAKYVFKNQLELRGVIGTAPRIPSYEELYTYFVDVNHNVQGNAKLSPEQGKSVFLHLNKNHRLNSGLQMQHKLSAWYIGVKDRIEMIIVNQSPLAYQYNNIDKYATWGSSITQSINYKNLSFNAGFTLSGVSKVIDSQSFNDDSFLYSTQFHYTLSCRFEKQETGVAAFGKYNGPQYQFVQKTNTSNQSVFEIGKQNAFTWLDASVRKWFFKKKIDVTAGAKNIMNITTINTTATEGGAHTDAASSIQMGYGRSCFLKIMYQLNF